MAHRGGSSWLLFTLIWATASLASPVSKQICNAGMCVNFEYEPCTTQLRLSGNALPSPQEINLAQNMSKCVDINTDQLIALGEAAGQDVTALRTLAQFDPEICFAISDLHVKGGESASFRARLYIHMKKKQFGIGVPDIAIPGMDQSIDLGSMCHGRPQEECDAACGWCGATSTCILGNSDGPLCGNCIAGYTWVKELVDPGPATTEPSETGEPDKESANTGPPSSNGHHSSGKSHHAPLFAFTIILVILVSLGGVGGGIYYCRKKQLWPFQHTIQTQADAAWAPAQQADGDALVMPIQTVVGKVVKPEPSRDDHL